jgi:hypothetical protein
VQERSHALPASKQVALQTSFAAIIGMRPADISRVVLINDNSGTGKSISDEQTIQSLFEEISRVQFIKNRKVPPAVSGYSIYIYPKNNKGYLAYTSNFGFSGHEGYTWEEESFWVETDPVMIYLILKDFYDKL